MSVDFFEEDSVEAEFTTMERPDDTVIYPDEQVGAFRSDGVVLMTDVPDVSGWQWRADEFNKVDAPERFDREYGEWVHRESIRDDVLDDRLEDTPESEVEAA